MFLCSGVMDWEKKCLRKDRGGTCSLVENNGALKVVLEGLEAVVSLHNFHLSTILLLLGIMEDTVIILHLQHNHIMAMVMDLGMLHHHMLPLRAKPLHQDLSRMVDIKAMEPKIPMQVGATVKVAIAKEVQHQHLEGKEGDRAQGLINLEGQCGLNCKTQRAGHTTTTLKQEPVSGKNLLNCSKPAYGL